MTEKDFLKLKTLFIQVFNNEPGYKVLHFIMNDLCGYQSPITTINDKTGDLMPNAMFHNDGRRGVYLDIRKLLSKEILQKVETMEYQIKKPEPSDDKEHPFITYHKKKKE